MLKTVAVSANKKTGPIAVTYRAGQSHTYGTCPSRCGLHPLKASGASAVDMEYLRAVFDAVPRGGVAWTYSHFAADTLPKPQAGKTVINSSCDTVAEAVRSMSMGIPATYTAPRDSGEWPQVHDGVKFVRCPAETVDRVNCQNCGGGRPLCARGDRSYVVVFVAHGTGAKRVGQDCGGGCYAASGPTAIQWHNTRKSGAANDADALRQFADSLPYGSMLRHHVAGDIGAEAVVC